MSENKSVEFLCTGIYYRQIDPSKDLISSKPFFGRLFDKLVTHNLNKYYELIKFHPITEYNGPKKIHHLLYREETVEVRQLTDLVTYNKKSNEYYDRPPDISKSYEEAKRYTESDIEIGSIKHSITNTKSIEYHFHDYKVVLMSAYNGTVLKQKVVKNGSVSSIHEYQFIAYSKINDEYTLDLYEFDLQSYVPNS